MDALVRQAIGERRLLTFRLHGLHRVAEPHLYGRHKGVLQLLVYQIRGESRSGGLPSWRRVDLAEVSDLELLDERFEAKRLTALPSGWDEVLAVVD